MAASAWEIPPASSHLFGWYIEDGYGSLAGAHGSHGAGAYGAIITVGFKNKHTGGLDTTYEYRFNDQTVARSWLALLRAAAEPGKVIWDMRRAGIVGHKV